MTLCVHSTGNRHQTICAQSDDQQPILSLRLVGDYLLVFRHRWMELHYIPPFPDAGGQLISTHDSYSYRFHLNYPDLSFTGASMSEPQPNPESVNDSCIIYILTHQAVHGFFYFRVTIYNPDYVPLGPRARMDVDLLGSFRIRRLALAAWLGPEGKRGIWMERSADAQTSVVAVSFDQSCPEAVPVESGVSLRGPFRLAPRIESTNEIFTVDTRYPNGK